MPNDVDSLRAREATVGRAAAWWAAFAQRLPEIEARLSGEAEWDLRAWMDEQVGAVHPALQWEFGNGGAGGGGRHLVISPGGAYHLRPMSESIIRRAPQIPGWSFREYRPAGSPEEVSQRVRARTGHIMGSTTVQVRQGHERRIDLVYQSLLAKRDVPAAIEVARAACEYLLGEDVAQRWVGHVDVVEMAHAIGEAFVPLVRVPSQVLAMITEVLDNLPNRPFCKLPALAKIEWKRHAPKHDDFAGQDDAMFGTTVVPEVREAATKPGFYSGRFSRQGETFCYLKIDAADVGLDDRYKRKKHIEEAIDAQLRDDGIGAVVGTATGRRYIYLDLAVLDVVKTLEAVRRRLLALEMLPVRSWLLFLDAELAGEYIGLRSATPAPPLWEPPRYVPPKPVQVPEPVVQSEASSGDSYDGLIDPIGN
jgi:hypothetical protein